MHVGHMFAVEPREISRMEPLPGRGRALCMSELTHRLRRLGATEAQQQPQKNTKVVSRREVPSKATEWQAGRAVEQILDSRHGGPTTVLPAGIENVFCATAATAPYFHAGPESAANGRSLFRRSRTLGDGSVLPGAGRGNGDVSRGAHRATAGCDTDGITETLGQSPSRPPLRRATSDTDAAVHGAVRCVVPAKQREQLAEPSAGSTPSTLPVLCRTASSTDTLWQRSSTKQDRLLSGAVTRLAVDTAWSAVSGQDVAGVKSGRPTVRRRNSLSVIPHRSGASASKGSSSGVRDRKKRETGNRPPADGDDDRISRGEDIGAGVRPIPRPISLNLGEGTSSFSSLHYYEALQALQANEKIDGEKARQKSGVREDGDGGAGTGTSAVRERSREPRQRRTIHRSRSAHQARKTPREGKETGRARWEDKPPSPAVAPSKLRRSSSLGRALCPVTPRSGDACGKDDLQQHRHKTRDGGDRGRQFRSEATTTEDREYEWRIDIRSISAGSGGVGDLSPSAHRRYSYPSSARSRHSRGHRSRSRRRSRSRSRLRPLEREGGREGIKKRVAAPPAEIAADGAAAAARSAAAGATAAAARAAAAADEAKATVKRRAASAAGGLAEAAAVATAAARIRRPGARGPAEDPPVTETKPAAAADGISLPEPSSVWVTRYLDFSSTYGLVFLLSDGSVGLLFKDNTKMVVDRAGETLDYAEPRGSWAASASSIHEAESGAGGRPQISLSSDSSTPHNDRAGDKSRYRYRLDSFPFFLRKKVRILRYVRAGLYEDRGGGEIEGCGTTMMTTAAATTAAGRNQREPLTFIEKWQRAGDTHCFELSHQVVQVIFSDGTEVLLSEDRQVITFVSEDGKRDIQTRRNMEHRTEVMKRVRCAEDFMFLMLDNP